MSSLRFARAALRARPAAIRLPVGRRTYADAVADKIKLSLAMPHQVRSDPVLPELLILLECIWNTDASYYLEPLQVHRRVRFPDSIRPSDIL